MTGWRGRAVRPAPPHPGRLWSVDVVLDGEAEARDELLELLGGAGELLRRRGDLLGGGAGLLRARGYLLSGRGGLLGHRGHLADPALGAIGLGGDLLDRGGDLRHARADLLDGGADLLERGPGLLDRRDAVLGALGTVGHDADDLLRLGLDLTDQPGDRARGALGLLGQLADLLGDDREAAALLAGARRLDGRVQRQEVRLLGDAGDRVDDAADLLGLASEIAHRGGHLVRGLPDPTHGGGDLRGRLEALQRDLARLLGGS